MSITTHDSSDAHSGAFPSSWLGIVLLPDNALRILPDQVRVPDVAYLQAQRRPKRGSPDAKVPRVAPDLAVEVLSEGNTPAEMQRKLADYFTAGVRLVWYIDPKSRTATVYTSTSDGRHVDADGALDGGDVLPGFVVKLGELFTRADERAWSSDE